MKAILTIDHDDLRQLIREEIYRRFPYAKVTATDFCHDNTDGPTKYSVDITVDLPNTPARGFNDGMDNVE